MRGLFPTDAERCLPIRVVGDADDVDGYLGGMAPAGVGAPAALSYFLTIRLATDPDQYVSIFVAEYEALASVRAHLNQPGLVWFVTHRPSPRGQSTAQASRLSPHGLRIFPEGEDWLDDGEGGRVIRSGHKLGGRPHLIRETTALRRGIETAAMEGFSYVLQVDFPESDDDPVSGPWPFGDGIFGAFGRAPYAAGDWRWWWDF